MLGRRTWSTILSVFIGKSKLLKTTDWDADTSRTFPDSMAFGLRSPDLSGVARIAVSSGFSERKYHTV